MKYDDMEPGEQETKPGLKTELMNQMKNAAGEQAAADSEKPEGIAPEHEEPNIHKDPAKWLRWALLMGGGLADAVTTHDALKRPGTAEGNPIMGKIAGNYPLLIGTKLGTNALLGLFTDLMHRKDYEKEANLSGIGAGAAQLGIAASNMSKGRKEPEPEP